MRNIEIKAKVRNVTRLLEKVRAISGNSCEEIKQEDTFYTVQKGRLKLRRFEGGDAELISYDRPNQEGPKLSEYDKVAINSGEVNNLNRVLDKALGTIGNVKKVRQLFMVDQTRIHVDSVEGLGDFMELEVGLKEDQSIQEGEEIAKRLMENLGITTEDLLSNAYMDLLLQKNPL